MARKARRLAGWRSAALTALAVGLLGAVSADANADTGSLVRPLDQRADHLLHEAAARSRTVMTILAELEQSDLIVLVEVPQVMPHDLAGDLRYVGTSATNRIVVVRVRATQSLSDQVAILGHELQHAREVSAAAEVRDAAGLAALLERIGRRTNPGAYETDAAVQATWQVRREINGG